MPQDGEINLSKAKAIYSINDVRLVDVREVDFANEFRLTFEVSLSISLTLLGSVLTSFNWIALATSIIFLSFGIWNIFRYRNKRKEIKSIK
jgi:hypothetical protein